MQAKTLKKAEIEWIPLEIPLVEQVLLQLGNVDHAVLTEGYAGEIAALTPALDSAMVSGHADPVSEGTPLH